MTYSFDSLTIHWEGEEKPSALLDQYLNAALEVLSRQIPAFLEMPQGNIETSLSLISSDQMHQLNREQRGKDKTTDVLSFPVHESLRPKQREANLPFPLELGDIMIAKEVAEAQAKEFDISYELEVIHLLVHGILHLCGYDHEISDKEEELMFDLEDKLMTAIYQKLDA